MTMKPKTPLNNQLEKSLLPRLKVLGFILIFFGTCACTWAIFYSPYAPSVETEFETENTAGPTEHQGQERRLNFYTISAIFIAVGLTCIAISNKKQKALKEEGSREGR